MSKATALRIDYFSVFCCTGAWLPKLYDYCINRGLTATQSALILSSTPIMMFAVQPLYGFLADKLGYKKALSNKLSVFVHITASVKSWVDNVIELRAKPITNAYGCKIIIA